MTVEPALEPRVEPVAANDRLHRTQKFRAFFVRYIGRSLIGVAAFEVEMEPRIGTGRPPVFRDGLVHRVDAERGMLLGGFLAVKRLDDPPFGVGRHALV